MATETRVNPTIIQLKRQWLRVAIAVFLLWACCFLFLSFQAVDAGRWLLFSGPVLFYILWNLRRHLTLNHKPQQPRLFSSLGVANLLSILRGVFIAIIAGLILLPWPQGPAAWAIVALVTVVGLADWFDGFVARRFGQETLLGRQLDIDLDGLYVMVLVLLGVSYGQLPAWFLLVGLARYFFLFGLWWRKRQGLFSQPLPPSIHRRLFAGIISGILTVAIWPIVPSVMSIIVATLAGVPFLLGFLRDWLVASGRLDANSAGYQRVQARLFLIFARQLPLLWRCLLALTLGFILLNSGNWLQPLNWVELFESWGLARPPFWATFFSLLTVAASVLILAGVASRLLSLILLFPIGFAISTLGLGIDNFLALVSTTMIFMFGSGNYALWQPDRRLVNRRGAAKKSGDEGLKT